MTENSGWRPRVVGRQGLVAMLAIVMLASTGYGFGAGAPASADGVPLRQVDWPAVLRNDPAITIDPDAYKLPGDDSPYIQVAAPGSEDGALVGYAQVSGNIYGDLDGDGAEEAIVPVFSGGTGGMFGYLLYREAVPAPRLILVETGYKLGFTIEGNRVVIYRPDYTEYDPNCCPSAVTRTVNALEGDRLVALVSEVEPNDVQDFTVYAFYRALDERRFEEAYAFYSPAFQASNPFEPWKDGYMNTQRIQVETTPGATPTEVSIELTATDAQPGGGTVTRKFTGTWTLVWSPERKRWLLDKASIRLA